MSSSSAGGMGLAVIKALHKTTTEIFKEVDLGLLFQRPQQLTGSNLLYRLMADCTISLPRSLGSTDMKQPSSFTQSIFMSRSIESGLTAAEIVHIHSVAHRLYLSCEPVHGLAVAHECAFGDFDFHVARRHVIAPRELMSSRRDIHRHDVDMRNVNGNGNRDRPASRRPLSI